MERITYRITLDAYKNGIQRTLQGFETADNMARRIAINLTAGGDTIEIPSDHVTAMMYVTTPNAKEPSINACEIDNNTVIYDVLPIVEEGITEMQLKLIKTDVGGARGVLAYPRFAVEVTQSNMDDGNAEQTTTFTALEDAVARANAVYDSRLLDIEIDKDCTFRAIYADGTVYENSYLNEALYNGNALLSESWAKGDTGMREDEETNNSKYFSNVSRSASEHADLTADEIRALAEETKLSSMLTVFTVDFADGDLKYISHNYDFSVDQESGALEAHGSKDIDIESLIEAQTEEIVGGILEEELRETNEKIEQTEKTLGEKIEQTEKTLGDKFNDYATLGDPNVYFTGILLGNTRETNAYIYSDGQNNIWFKFVDGNGQVQYINMASLYSGVSTANAAYTMAQTKLSNQMTTLAEGADINGVTEIGFYTGHNLANAPVNGWVTFIQMRVNNDPNYCVRILSSHGYTKMFYQTQNSGNWGGWIELSKSSDLANYLPKSGGNIFGQINTDNSIAVTPDDRAFQAAPIVFNAYTAEGASVRAGCGFHNQGINGAFLYLGTDNFMHLKMNHGADHRLIADTDWRIIVESAFTVSGDDIILNWL